MIGVGCLSFFVWGSACVQVNVSQVGQGSRAVKVVISFPGWTTTRPARHRGRLEKIPLSLSLSLYIWFFLPSMLTATNVSAVWGKISWEPCINVLFCLSLFYFVYRRRKTTQITSNGRWTRSWSGRKLNGARFVKFSRTCTTPRSRNGWANAGRRCRRRSARLTSPRRNDFVNCTCKNTPITNTGRARRPNWVRAVAPVLRLRRPRHRPARSAIRAATATAAAAAVAWLWKRWRPSNEGAWLPKEAGRRLSWHRVRAALCWRRRHTTTTTTATVRPTRTADSLRWPRCRRRRLRRLRERVSRRRWVGWAPSTTIASSCAWPSTASLRRAFATARTCRRRC